MLQCFKDPDLAKIRFLTEKLEHTETFFEAFLRQCPFVMWLKDYSSGEGKMVFISDRYAEIFGVDDSDYHGKTDDKIWPETVAAMFKKQDMEVMETGENVWMHEPTPIAKEPKWKYCMTLKFPIRDSNGKITGVGGIAWPSDGGS